MENKYIFFDFNGTILNDVDLCINILNEMLTLKKLKTVSKEEYLEIFTFPIKEYYKNAGFDFSEYSFEELANYFIEKYQAASYECSLYPYLKEILVSLRKKGYHLVVLSASEINNLMLQLNKFELTSYFDDILGTSDIYAKSKEEIAYNYVNKHHLNAKDLIFIGDTLHDFEISKKLNGKAILVDFGHQSHYKLKSSGAKIISSFLELENIL